MNTTPNEWRDISEAPKDGTVFLFWPRRDREHATARWSDDRFVVACCGQSAYGITHWMPLPAPPSGDATPDAP